MRQLTPRRPHVTGACPHRPSIGGESVGGTRLLSRQSEARMSQSRRWWFVGLGALLVGACSEPLPPLFLQLVFTVQPRNATAGDAISPVVAVAIEDASGHTVTSATNVVTVALG